MILIVGTIRLPSENLAKAHAAMKRMILASRAEDGCLDYSYAEDVLEPGLVHVHELWRDQSSLQRHWASAHICEWRAQWLALRIGDRRLTRYEVSGATIV